MSYFDVPSIWREIVSLTIMYYRTVTIIMLPGYVILWCTFYLKRDCLIDYYVLQNCNYYYVTWLCHTLMYLLFEERKVVSLTINVLQNCNYYYVTWLCHTLMYLLFEESTNCLIDYYVLQNCNYYYVTWLCHTLMYLLFEERPKLSHWLLCITEL